MSDKKRNESAEWKTYTGESKPGGGTARFPPAPPWRTFSRNKDRRGETYRATEEQVLLVNAALILRRPLLVTGKPGVGKSSLAYSVAKELGLGEVLRWSITSRTTLVDGLYRYDAIGRMQEVQINVADEKQKEKIPDIGKFVTLGPLGTAMLPSDKPRALLIDEIDKSDIDLPNDLLNIFEEGEFEIPELARVPESQQPVTVRLFQSDATTPIEFGKVTCTTFPFVVMTSNGERDFPAPFLRRCLRLNIEPPSVAELKEIVQSHLSEHLKQLDASVGGKIDGLIAEFVKNRDERNELLANDQLLNAVFVLTRGIQPETKDLDELLKAILRPLGGADSQ
ncbi:MAG: AAA family ATPase [Blastocatellia bacterium]